VIDVLGTKAGETGHRKNKAGRNGGLLPKCVGTVNRKPERKFPGKARGQQNKPRILEQTSQTQKETGGTPVSDALGKQTGRMENKAGPNHENQTQKTAGIFTERQERIFAKKAVDKKRTHPGGDSPPSSRTRKKQKLTEEKARSYTCPHGHVACHHGEVVPSPERDNRQLVRTPTGSKTPLGAPGCNAW
jgi:hypothetical protein